MSFINGYTINPVDETYIGFYCQTTPFTAFTSYPSASTNYIYDTYTIPKGVWLISASALFEVTGTAGITQINLNIAFPNNNAGKNLASLGINFPISQGYSSYASSVFEPYYSDGTIKCGICIFGTTTDNSDYVLQGNSTTMTYVKIA